MSKVIMIDRDEENIPNGFYKLLERANHKNADEQDLENLRWLLKENPEFSMAAANMAKAAISSLLQAITKKKKGFRMCLKTSLKELECRMGYDTASPLEQMIIENISICWLRLQWVECIVTRCISKQSELEISAADYYLNNAQTRYLQALDTLARVRMMEADHDETTSRPTKEK